eukprot:m.854761 g.854761  ORF g.854761 m.854761 type:complete len:552 (+) comp23504_c0_seq24:1513-3168(+)
MHLCKYYFNSVFFFFAVNVISLDITVGQKVFNVQHSQYVLVILVCVYLVFSTREQLNLQLDELSTEYHRTKTSIDLSAYNLESSSKTSTSAAPHCSHGPTKLCTVQKDGKNKGRHFYACPKPKGQGCNFFLWADQQQRSKSFPMNDTRVKVTTANELEQVFRAGGICFFADCYLQRSKRNWHARHESASSESKTVFLSLDRCSRGMAFAKRDLWVVSTSVNFDSEQTAVLESVFFGPSSEGSIELKPITAKSAGILKSNVPLYAIKAFNAATELKCVENLTKGIKELPSLPILQTLLGKQNDPRGPHPLLGKTAVPLPQTKHHTQTLYVRSNVRDQMCEEYIVKYTLNKDQGDALRTCTSMLTCYDSEDSETFEPVVLIHGVFGAGKSYFVAVLVLLVCELFSLSEKEESGSNGDEDVVRNEKQQNRSILISSGTNVAVDRILQSLLDMGMSDFVRVGSARKIAPTVLPYSTHGSSSSDNKGIKDLNEWFCFGSPEPVVSCFLVECTGSVNLCCKTFAVFMVRWKLHKRCRGAVHRLCDRVSFAQRNCRAL